MKTGLSLHLIIFFIDTIDGRTLSEGVVRQPPRENFHGQNDPEPRCFPFLRPSQIRLPTEVDLTSPPGKSVKQERKGPTRLRLISDDKSETTNKSGPQTTGSGVLPNDPLLFLFSSSTNFCRRRNTFESEELLYYDHRTCPPLPPREPLTLRDTRLVVTRHS